MSFVEKDPYGKLSICVYFVLDAVFLVSAGIVTGWDILEWNLTESIVIAWIG